MARTFTSGRTTEDPLATEPTLLEVLAALQNIEVDIEQQANPNVVMDQGHLDILNGSNSPVTGAYVVPFGKKLRVKGISVTADGDGRFYLRVNGSDTHWFWHNSWAQKGTTVQVEFVFVAGDTVEVEAANTDTHPNVDNHYWASWWGYLEDA